MSNSWSTSLDSDPSVVSLNVSEEICELNVPLLFVEGASDESTGPDGPWSLELVFADDAGGGDVVNGADPVGPATGVVPVVTLSVADGADSAGLGFSTDTDAGAALDV
jgi:hypothetical protein